MRQYPKLPLLLTAGFSGLITAYAITTLYRGELDSPLEWGGAISLLAFGFGAVYFLLLPSTWAAFQSVPARLRAWGLVLAVVSALFFSSGIGLAFLPSLALAGFILATPTLRALQELSGEQRLPRFMAAWAFSGLASFFVLGFLKNFYPSFLESLLLTILSSVLLTLVLEGLLERVQNSLRNNPSEKIIPLAVLAAGLVLIVLTVRTLAQYPQYFSAGFFLPKPHSISVFFGALVLSQGWAALISREAVVQKWLASPFFLWMKRDLPALLLAAAISISTYLLATALVSPDIRFLDIYFQIDSPFWVNYLTGQADQLITMRAVHPFVLLILRPPVWLISLLLNGDKFHAALLLNVTVGGVCVYLAWLFFKRRTGNTAYALLLAAFLGLSNAHLALSVFLESYIFSAAALITFILLLQFQSGKFPYLVMAGLATFGITITNFIQTCIAHLLVKRDVKLIFQYVMIVLALAVPLAFVQNVFYPTSDPIYIPTKFKAEAVNIDAYLDLGPELARKVFISRMNVTFRNITLFSMVAPRPITRFNEPHCMPLCFKVMHYFRGEYRFASYVGFGSWLTRTWFLGLVTAGLIFAWRLIKSPREAALQAALALNLMFNFALHLKYGDDPLLYTPNWTYALVFFFGLSFERLADRKWWQSLLLIFLAGLLVNNLNFYKTIFEGIQPFFP